MYRLAVFLAVLLVPPHALSIDHLMDWSGTGDWDYIFRPDRPHRFTLTSDWMSMGADGATAYNDPDTPRRMGKISFICNTKKGTHGRFAIHIRLVGAKFAGDPNLVLGGLHGESDAAAESLSSNAAIKYKQGFADGLHLKESSYELSGNRRNLWVKSQARKEWLHKPFYERWVQEVRFTIKDDSDKTRLSRAAFGLPSPAIWPVLSFCDPSRTYREGNGLDLWH